MQGERIDSSRDGASVIYKIHVTLSLGYMINVTSHEKTDNNHVYHNYS